MLFPDRCHDYSLSISYFCEKIINVIVNILKSRDNFKRSTSIQGPQVHQKFSEISQGVLMKNAGTNFIPR